MTRTESPNLRRWSAPRLSRIRAHEARMPDRVSNGEGSSGRSGQLFKS